MGKVVSEIGESEAAFIASQKLFYVATAPLSQHHHVNVSPKANGCVVVDPHTVVYADLTGSGAETAAHVIQNGRMTLMFCNIEAGSPCILRLYGTAEVLVAENVPDSLRQKLNLPAEVVNSAGFRALYKLHVHRVARSCGYSLPIMEFRQYRTTLEDWSGKKGHEAMHAYVTLKNSFSIDGLPSLGLLRSDAPNVEPVLEEGYVLGKSVNKPSVTSRIAIWASSATQRYIQLSVRDVVLGGCVLFGAGVVVGRYISLLAAGDRTTSS